MENRNCVYALKHNPTGKVYVGCSRNVERRVHQHIVQLISGRHPVEQMQEDFNKYGNDFTYYVLFEAYAAYDAFLMERNFMSLLNSRDPSRGYNYKDNSNDFSLESFRARKAI